VKFPYDENIGVRLPFSLLIELTSSQALLKIACFDDSSEFYRQSNDPVRRITELFTSNMNNRLSNYNPCTWCSTIIDLKSTTFKIQKNLSSPPLQHNFSIVIHNGMCLSTTLSKTLIQK